MLKPIVNIADVPLDPFPPSSAPTGAAAERFAAKTGSNSAFGLFYIGYGGGWLIGSISTGLLYQHSRIGLILFAVAVQLLSIPFFLLGARADRAGSRGTV